jgi:S-adenosylmethionine-diacylgycerolhomoserine-N-methlytransferase
LPGPFRQALFGFLARFHVSPRDGLHRELYRLSLDKGGNLAFTPLYRGYAWELVLTAAGAPLRMLPAEAA